MAKVSFKAQANQPTAGTSNVTEATPEMVASDAAEAQALESAPVAEVAPAAEQAVTAVAVTTPAPVSAPTPFQDDDNISMEDIIIPPMHLVQKVGDLSNIFTPGTIVLNKGFVLYSPPGKDNVPPATPPVRLIVVGFKPTRFCQKTEDGRGEIYDSEEEVNENGGTLEYSEAEATGKPLFQRLATALIFIEGNDKSPLGLFPHDYEGKRWAIALWSMKSTGYNHGAKHILTAKKMGALRKGYRTGSWELSTELKSYTIKGSQVWVHVPKLKLVDAVSPEWIAWSKDLLGF